MHDLAELRRLAEAAQTEEPWEYKRYGDYWGIYPTGIEGKDNYEGPEDIYRYIAAVNPAVVLALLDRLERAEAERDRLREDLGAADRHIAEDATILAEMATRIGVLEEALRPFAVWWQRFGPDMTDKSAHAMFARAADVLGLTREEESEVVG